MSCTIHLNSLSVSSDLISHLSIMYSVMGELPVTSGDIHDSEISPFPTDLTNKLIGSVGGSILDI